MLGKVPLKTGKRGRQHVIFTSATRKNNRRCSEDRSFLNQMPLISLTWSNRHQTVGQAWHKGHGSDPSQRSSHQAPADALGRAPLVLFLKQEDSTRPIFFSLASSAPEHEHQQVAVLCGASFLTLNFASFGVLSFWRCPLSLPPTVGLLSWPLTASTWAFDW